MRNPNTVKIRIHEQISQRYETIKREDWLLTFDLFDIFQQKTREMMTKLGIQTIDPLLECLPDDNQKTVFTNLFNGYSPKAERLKAEKQENDLLAQQN